MMFAQQDYGVRVIRAYANQSVGRIIFPNGLERGALLKGGWVEIVVPEVPEITEDVPEAPMNRAVGSGARGVKRVGVR